MKIAVIGNAGSGKSILALQLHNILHIPLFHLDQYFWKPGWQRPDREEFAKIHHSLCEGDHWIIEGMAIRLFEYRIKKADLIIFLDIPLYRCLYRIFKRVFLNFGKVFFSSAPGCPERFPNMEFLNYVWNFNAKQKPEIEKLLQDYREEKKIFIVRDEKQLKDLLENFENTRNFNEK
jgi:adenylate kinase family enzyme